MFARPVAVQLRTALFMIKSDGQQARPAHAIGEDLQAVVDESGNPKVFASYGPQIEAKGNEPVLQYLLCPVVIGPDRSGELLSITRGESSGSIVEILVAPSEVVAVSEVVHVEQEPLIKRV
jgi:hypothetical protein